MTDSGKRLFPCTDRRAGLLLSAALWMGSLGCDKAPSPPKEATPPKEAPASGGAPAAEVKKGPTPEEVLAKAQPLFGKLEAEAKSEANPLTPEKIALGRMLYFDKRLSKSQEISCNTCHDLGRYGIDPREQDGKRSPTSLGHKNQPGERNSPTVYNAAFHFVQFWDGRAKDVEEQAKGPILNPVEMGMTGEPQVLKVLESIPEYQKAFRAAFPGDKKPISYDNVGKAIGAFERKLVTPSRFDEFLAGKTDALKPEEVAGLDLFISKGCIACHLGNQLGGSIYQKLGLMKPYATKDEGRFKITKNESDKFMFKVPSLRNVAETAPYLHDGSLATLEETIAMMAEYQTPFGKMADADVKSIATFLASLTGTIPAEYVQAPELPKSTKKTPKPDPN